MSDCLFLPVGADGRPILPRRPAEPLPVWHVDVTNRGGLCFTTGCWGRAALVSWYEPERDPARLIKRYRCQQCNDDINAAVRWPEGVLPAAWDRLRVIRWGDGVLRAVGWSG